MIRSLLSTRLFFTLATVVILVGGIAWWRQSTGPVGRLRRGREAIRLGDYETALLQVRRLDAAGYKDQAHFLAGEVCFRQHQYPQAVAEFNQIRDADVLRVDAAAMSGQCLFILGQYHEAARVFRFVVSQDSANLVAHRGLADILYHQGALVQAIEHLAAVTRLDPTDGRAPRSMGKIQRDLDKPHEAIINYRLALSRELTAEQAEEAREELAQLLIKDGKYAEGLALVEQCRPAAAAEPLILALRAECLLLGSQQRTETRRLLDDGLRQHPAAGPLLKLRARLHLEENEPAAAAQLLERIVKQDPHDFASRYQLAQAYQRLNRPAEAAEQVRLSDKSKESFLELTRLNQEADRRPWDAPLLRQLAALCRQLDKPELAAMWEQSAAACPPADAARSRD